MPTYAWILGHAGVHDNKVADYVAKTVRYVSGVSALKTGPQIDGNLRGMNGRTA